MSIGSKTSESDQLQSAVDQLEAGALLAKLIKSSPEGGFSAKHLLTANPLLRAFPGCVVDLAYEQYCRDTDAGKNVTPTEFVKDFSNVQQSLYRILEFDQLLHEHPSLVEGVPAERWPKPGESFCEFQLEEQIGRGALSRVFVAREARLGRRQVVVKVCIRGAREADLLGKLEYDGIARIHSVHADDATGLGVICMPYVTRVTMHHLTEWLTTFAEATSNFGSQNATELIQHVSRLNDVDPSLKEKTLTKTGYGFVNPNDDYSTVILKWGITLADALTHAHRKDVLHLDVKPGNVLVLPDLSVSLLDFNLASTESDDVRLAGGTLPYMASEQLLNLLDSMQGTGNEVSASTQHESTEATDVFGLCATLWHLVSGEPPFGVTVDSESRRQAAKTMLERQESGVATEQITRVASVLPPAAVDLLLAGLCFEQHGRPAAASQLSEMLTDILPADILVPAATVPNLSEAAETAAVPQRKSKWRVWAGAVFLILIVAITLSLDSMWNAAPGHGNGTASQSAPARPEHEAAFHDALTLMKAEKFDEAINIVQPYLNVSQDCRLVDLYCRTCRLPTLTLRPAGNPINSGTQIRKSWSDVRAEWERLASSGGFSAAASLNIAYIELEFGNFTAANEAFQQALAFGLPDPKGARMQLIVQLTHRQESSEYTDDELHKMLRQLEQDALVDGSRGEFLALLAAHIEDVNDLANIDVESAETNVAVKNLFDLFKQYKYLTGEASGATILMKCRAMVLSRFMTEINRSSRKTGSPPPHRIHRVLLFPGQDL
ncbi:MAG: protein kinase [Fuerstiella sp.]|nr:protein kinase [Fuerstiella sp.]MCP4855574.1 protein kinase [Fuerstiella sp.]